MKFTGVFLSVFFFSLSSFGMGKAPSSEEIQTQLAGFSGNYEFEKILKWKDKTKQNYKQEQECPEKITLYTAQELESKIQDEATLAAFKTRFRKPSIITSGLKTHLFYHWWDLNVEPWNKNPNSIERDMPDLLFFRTGKTKTPKHSGPFNPLSTDKKQQDSYLFLNVEDSRTEMSRENETITLKRTDDFELDVSGDCWGWFCNSKTISDSNYYSLSVSKSGTLTYEKDIREPRGRLKLKCQYQRKNVTAS